MSAVEEFAEPDAHEVRLATDPPEDLRPFNLAGVLGPAEVHGARTLAQLTGDERPEVLLAAALALRAPQHGHICIELGAVPTTVTVTEDAPVAASELAWPDPVAWRDVLANSPLVRVRPEGTPQREELDPEHDRPLVLVGNRVYLDRYWRYERRVAEALRRRAERVDDTVDLDRVRAALDRLLPAAEERPDRQRLAVATGALRDLTVIAGGPGTGKTHVVARLLALLHELADDGWPRVAVTAPTGKAADRLTAELRSASAELDVSDAVRERLRGLSGSTLHRLLGWRPGTRFRQGRQQRLPHDVVVVDETSMVDLPLMAKLLVALRRDTRLVLVGDPDQLASVEAGAVLADIVGPSGDGLRMTEPNRQRLEAGTGEPLAGDGADVEVLPADAGGIDDAVVVLGAVHRFGADSGIARLATAIHAGDAAEAVGVLRSDHHDLTWVEAEGDARDRHELTGIREQVANVGRRVVAAAGSGDAAAALDALDDVRVLCAHRRGHVGVAGWVPLVERWLTEDVDGFDASTRFHVGRPVMVTRNDRRLRLFNGDVGVVVRTADSVQVAFHGREGPRHFSPGRLEDMETVHATTIHKSQGSQFRDVVVVLPEDSRLLTRELLYTAVTRAREGVTLVATEAAVRGAISQRVARASGLRTTLWTYTPATA